MRATQLLTAGLITATEAAKYKDPIVACKEAKPISTFGGSWTGRRGNLYLFSWEFGVLRPCYHALRQPVGAADRALLHN